jgi:hypothetical protein
MNFCVPGSNALTEMTGAFRVFTDETFAIFALIVMRREKAFGLPVGVDTFVSPGAVVADAMSE